MKTIILIEDPVLLLEGKPLLGPTLMQDPLPVFGPPIHSVLLVDSAESAAVVS